MTQRFIYNMRSCSIATVLAFLLVTPLLRAAPIEGMLPRETLLIVKVENMHELQKSLNEHPVLKALTDESIVDFFKPALLNWSTTAGESFEAEMGVDFETFLGYFPGQIAICVFADEETTHEDGITEQQPRIVLIAEYEGDFDKLQELIDNSAEYDSEQEGVTHELREEKFLGATIFIEEGDADGETVVYGSYLRYKNIFGVGGDAEAFRRIVELAEGKGGATLSNTLEALPEEARSGNASAYAYLNLAAIVEAMKAPFMSGFNDATPAGISTETLLDTLQLQQLKDIYMEFRVDEQNAETTFLMSYREKKGILRLLAYGSGVHPESSLVPDTAVSASLSRFDIGEAWTEMEKLIGQISPDFLNQYNAQLAMLKTMGLDIKTSVINNFGDEIVYYSAFPNGTSRENGSIDDVGQCIALRIKDRQGIEMTLEFVKNMVSQGGELFARREFLENSIYTLKQKLPQGSGAEAPPAIAYAITDSYLLVSVGPGQLIEASLSRLAKPGATVWDLPHVNNAIREYDEEASVLNYQDLSLLLMSMCKSMADIQSRMNTAQDGVQICDPQKLPSIADDGLFAITHTRVDEEGVFSTTRIKNKDE